MLKFWLVIFGLEAVQITADMSYNFYLFIHVLGALLLLLGYGALLVRAVLAADNKPFRIWGSVISGIGLLFLLVAGFGLQARLGIGWPTWFILKMVTWLLLGGALAFINRRPDWNKILWVAVIVLAGFAAWLGIFGKVTPALQ